MRFCRALLHCFISSQRLLTLKCNLVSSHLRKLRLARVRLHERASLSNGNARHLPRFIALFYIFAVAFYIKAQFDFLAILWGRKNTFAIRPSKCKCACGTFALARRCSQLYAQGFRPPSRRLGGLRADFAHSQSGFRLFGERIVLNIIKLYPQKDFAIFSGHFCMPS